MLCVSIEIFYYFFRRAKDPYFPIYYNLKRIAHPKIEGWNNLSISANIILKIIEEVI